jgi:hypothetical protein
VKGLSINNLSDTAALKMTRVNWCQLHCLYTAFDLKGLLKPMQEKLAFLMWNVFNGAPCCYQIHPEEVFLFSLCRLAMGMLQVHIMDTYISGNKICWTCVYPWMLKYLNKRYVNIVGHQGQHASWITYRTSSTQLRCMSSTITNASGQQDNDDRPQHQFHAVGLVWVH